MEDIFFYPSKYSIPLNRHENRLENQSANRQENEHRQPPLARQFQMTLLEPFLTTLDWIALSRTCRLIKRYCNPQKTVFPKFRAAWDMQFAQYLPRSVCLDSYVPNCPIRAVFGSAVVETARGVNVDTVNVLGSGGNIGLRLQKVGIFPTSMPPRQEEWDLESVCELEVKRYVISDPRDNSHLTLRAYVDDRHNSSFSISPLLFGTIPKATALQRFAPLHFDQAIFDGRTLEIFHPDSIWDGCHRGFDFAMSKWISSVAEIRLTNAFRAIESLYKKAQEAQSRGFTFERLPELKEVWKYLRINQCLIEDHWVFPTMYSYNDYVEDKHLDLEIEEELITQEQPLIFLRPVVPEASKALLDIYSRNLELCDPNPISTTNPTTSPIPKKLIPLVNTEILSNQVLLWTEISEFGDWADNSWFDHIQLDTFTVSSSPKLTKYVREIYEGMYPRRVWSTGQFESFFQAWFDATVDFHRMKLKEVMTRNSPWRFPTCVTQLPTYTSTEIGVAAEKMFFCSRNDEEDHGNPEEDHGNPEEDLGNPEEEEEEDDGALDALDPASVEIICNRIEAISYENRIPTSIREHFRL